MGKLKETIINDNENESIGRISPPLLFFRFFNENIERINSLSIDDARGNIQLIFSNSSNTEFLITIPRRGENILSLEDIQKLEGNTISSEMATRILLSYQVSYFSYHNKANKQIIVNFHDIQLDPLTIRVL